MQDQPTHSNKHISRAKIVILAAAFGAVLLAIGGWLLFQNNHKPSAATPPELVTASRTTRIYYPSTLPKNIQYVAASATLDDSLVSYALITNNKEQVAVTIQEKPEEVLFGDFYDRVLQNKADVFNRHGKAVVGTADNKTIGSLVTDKEWVIVTAPISINSADISAIVSSLEPTK